MQQGNQGGNLRVEGIRVGVVTSNKLQQGNQGGNLRVEGIRLGVVTSNKLL
jgi:hypothetical protein